MSADQAKEPEQGDLIEIFHTGYQHWAVYVGDGYVVHLLGPDCLVKAGKTTFGHSVRTKITKDKLDTVVNGNDYKVNNLHDHEKTPRPTEKIVEEALSYVDTDADYSIWHFNCEHFATKCRYGEPRSRQAETGLTAANVLGAGATSAEASKRK